VLPLGDVVWGVSHRGSTATGGTSYGAYDRGGVLPSGEHYRRKPQGAATGGSHRRKLLREAGAVGYSYGGGCLILTSQFRCSSGFRGNVEWCNMNCMLQRAVGAACYYGGSRLRSCDRSVALSMAWRPL